MGELPGDPAGVPSQFASVPAEIIDALRPNRALSTSELSARLNRDSSAIEAALHDLERTGLIKLGRWRRWSLIQPLPEPQSERGA